MNDEAIRQALRAYARRHRPTETDLWPAIRQQVEQRRSQAPSPGGARRLGRLASLGAALMLLGGLALTLRPLETPGGSPTVVPTRSLASALGPRGTIVPADAPGPLGILYGLNLPDPADDNQVTALASIDLATGTVRGAVPSAGGQGAGWALSPDGRRAYLLDNDATQGLDAWRLTELETPSLRVLRRVAVPNAFRARGSASIVAVAVDGREVYVRTLESRAAPGEYARGGDDAVFGLAVFDVAQGTITRVMRLVNIGYACNAMAALADGDLLVHCGGAMAWIDPREGRIVHSLAMPPGSLVVSPDSRRAWHIDRYGLLSEIDLAARRLTRRAHLTRVPGAEPTTVPVVEPPTAPTPATEMRVAAHEPGVTADGDYLFVLGVATERVGEFGQARLVWVVDTGTLRVEREIALSAPAASLAPTPDGRFLVVATSLDATPAARAWAIDVMTGQEVGRLPGPSGGLAVR